MHYLLTTLFIILGFTLNAQNVAIRFQVDMSYQIELGRFNSGNTLDIAGTFNGWNGAQSILADTDDDDIYEITIDGFSVGETIEFKFRRNAGWDGTEEFPGGGSNRSYTVKEGENEPVYWYNDEVNPNGAPIANFNARDQRIYSESIIHFNNTSAGQISSYEWKFEGGFPATSSEQNPVIRYPWTGTYDVSLVVKGNGESSEIKLEDYITVEARDEEEIEWWNHAVFYEIFVRSFYDSDGDGIGDFNGIIEKLDYLNDGDPNTDDDLGITGIWLMPIHESPSYHGYDVIDYKSINPDYGTMDDFRRFLQAAHDRGIRVIIDYVVNHTSTQHPWYQNAVSGSNADKRNFYRWTGTKPSYNGPWGQEVWHNSPSGFYYGLFWGGMPDLNYETPAVKEEIFEIADFWLEDIGIDGFRLDAVKYIVEEGNQLEDTEATFEFFRDFRDHYKATSPSSFTVGEAWTSTDKVRKYVEEDGIDFCFDFDLAYTMQDALNTGNASRTMEQLQRVYNIYPDMQYGTFLSNHDQNRVMSSFNGDERKMKTAAAIYLTTPGVPFIYYGEEIGMRGEKPDEFLRRPMQWSDERSAGFTTGVPWITPDGFYTVYNVAEEADNPASLLNWYKKLIQIRNENELLQTGTFQVVPNNSDHVISFLRQGGESSLLVLINVASRIVEDIDLDMHLSQIFSKTYEATNLVNSSISTLEVTAEDMIEDLKLSAYEVRIYQLDETTSTETLIENKDLKIYPNPSSGVFTLEFAEDMKEQVITVTNIAGEVVFERQLVTQKERNILDLSHLSKGLYFLRLGNGITKKVVVE